MEKCDVAIIGGGILGCATAYFLVRQSQIKVTVFERKTLAAAATSRAAALFNRARPREPERRMVRDTLAVIGDLEAELGESLNFRKVGSLAAAESHTEREKLNYLVNNCVAEGDDFRWIDAREGMKRTPWLSVDDDHLIAWCPDDGYLDPYLLCSAYGRAAREGGAILKQGVEVTNIVLTGQRLTGLETTDGPVSADIVIDAAGAWSSLLARRVSIALPLAPVRSHYWITESRAPFDSSHPILIMPDARAYARPEIGRMLFGIRDAHSAYVTPDNLPADIAGFSFDDDHGGWGALQAGIGPLLRYCPALEYTGIEHYISGPSAYTPDGSFVIGPVSDLEGFIAVTGCCGAGIAHSAGFGRSAAALALGLDLPYDLTPYRPERFGEFDPLSNGFCYRCAASRSAKTAA